MQRPDFERAFANQIRLALEEAENRLSVALPRSVAVELHGAGHEGTVLSVEDAARALFLGPNRFFRIIDLGVLAIEPEFTCVFVRASAHTPGPWHETWDPKRAGPFKQLGPEVLLLRAKDKR